MSERAPVVVLSSIDWDAAWQRHQIFAAQFAARGHSVHFVETTGFRAPRLGEFSRVWAKLRSFFRAETLESVNPIPAGVRIIAPKALPPSNTIFQAINTLFFVPALARRLPKRALVIAYLPTPSTVALIRALNPAVAVYDCVANFKAHPSAPPRFASTERQLLDLSDLVVCDSDFLFEQKCTEHPRVLQLHQGVADEFFAAQPAAGLISFASYGTWVPDYDHAFLSALCDSGLKVTICGFLRAPPPADKRVKVLGPVPRAQLVRRLESFDGFLLPHRINDFMRGVIPAKIYECLAMGRPVIATPLPSLKPLANQGLIYMGATPADWVRIAKDLPRTETPELRARRVALAREHTHEREFARLVEAIGNL